MYRNFEGIYRIINLVTNTTYDSYDNWWDAVDAYLGIKGEGNYAIFNIKQVGYFKQNAVGDIVNYITGEVGCTDKEIFLHTAEKIYDAAH